jgi:alkaline phosphatase
MSCGQKSYSGAIGVDIDQLPLQHVMEMAEELDKATGLVTSVEWSHATPAAYRAHNVSRNNYAEIAQELIASGLDVIMGAGHPHYDDDGQYSEGDPAVPGDWKYVGGYDQWQALVDGTAGGDNPWTLIDEKADFEALADGSLVLDRVCGTTQTAKTLQYNRSNMPGFNDPEPPYTVDMIANVPTLATMVKGALNVLGQDEDGFVMMVEGGAVDWAGHGRTLGRLIEEQDDFNNAYAEVAAWVEANSSWDETLVVVTGDHETGFLWGAGVDPEDLTTWFAPVQDNGAGNVPGFYFYSAPGDDWQNPSGSAGHTNQAIPFFVRGAGAEHVASFADESDPVVGYYLDNTELGLACFDLLTGSVPVEDPSLPGDQVPTAAVALDQNYPNPFNPQTTIAFNLPRNEQVRLNIFDVQGHLVRTLVDGVRGEGQHTVVWSGDDNAGQRVASGTYVYRLETEQMVLNRTMVLIK